MSELREIVSVETIERAIRGRLALICGTESPHVVQSLSIQEIPTTAEGVNWQLAIDPTSTPVDGIGAALQAAANVAGSFNVRLYH
jgi:hypothetical protein